MNRTFIYPFTVTRVIDGDTVEGDADLGFYIKRHVTVRLIGVNTPEKVGKEKEAGKLVLSVVANWIDKRRDLLELHSAELDKFGRVLGDIVCTENGTQVSLSDMLIAEKLAHPYTGDKRTSFSDKAISAIISRAASILL